MSHEQKTDPQFVTRRGELEQALLLARHCLHTAEQLQHRDSAEWGNFASWGDKWASDARPVIASYEFFLANAATVPAGYRFAGEIDDAVDLWHHMQRTMALFGVELAEMAPASVVELPVVPTSHKPAQVDLWSMEVSA